jgi:hypothetical protein
VRLLPALALLAACAGETDDPPEVVDTTDTPSDTVVDTVETDPPEETGDTGVEPALPNHEVVAHGVVTCADPDARLEARYDVLHATAIDDDATLPRRLEGGGMAVGDFDDDGRYDILIVGYDESDLRMQTTTMVFYSEPERLGGVDLTRGSGATAVDYDGDGDLDLFVTRFDQPNVMLANDGTGQFTDVTVSTGITGTHKSQTSSWGDMDGDGDLDLFVGNYGPRPTGDFGEPMLFATSDPSQLWENLGDGTFVERSDLFPQDLHDAHTFMSSWLDVDLDGDSDLWIVNDFGATRPSRLYLNTPAGLVEDTTTGLNTDMSGMGVGVGDVNNDELPDFLISSFREQRLFVSRAGPYWIEEHLARGMVVNPLPDVKQLFGWGAELADVDNDGDDDGVVTFGWWDEYAEEPEQLDGYWVQDASGDFSDQAPSLRLDDPNANRGLLALDLNDDGTLDLLKRRLGRSTPMYVSRCDDKAWLRVRPRMATVPNTHAVGARVRVVGPDKVWSRHVTAGGTSMYSSAPAEVHVGLGDLDEVAVEIVWPDGERSDLGTVDTRQILDVTRVR